MDGGDARTVGRRLYQIRNSRGKSLRVVAGLAGMSTTQLWRIEHGERALDSLSEIVALAEALQIAPSELMRLPVPAPANGHTDSAINAVFLALMAARRSRPGGQLLPVEALRTRVMTTVDAHCRCDRTGEVDDPEGRNRTIILWRETDLVGDTVVRRVVVTLDATMNTATVLTRPQAIQMADALIAAAQ